MSLVIVHQDPRVVSLFVTPGPQDEDPWLARLGRLLRASTVRLVAAAARLGQVIHRWVGRELQGPVLCLLAVYVGVLCSMLLPAVLLPVPAQVVLTPLAALPIAVSVADQRAYRRWRGAGRAPLGARLIRACSDGVLWWCWWRPVVG